MYACAYVFVSVCMRVCLPIPCLHYLSLYLSISLTPSLSLSLSISLLISPSFQLFLLHLQSKINLKASEWHIRKDSTPSTGGFLELTTNGVEITIPLTDDDLQNILAVQLSKAIPLYF